MSSDARRKLAGVILAAGASKRLGSPKQTIKWQGKSMLSRAVEACLKVCESGLVVVTGANADEVEACLTGYPVTIVRNRDWADGMSGSLHLGLEALNEFRFAGVLLSLSDQPLVTEVELKRLANAWAACPDRPAAAYYNDVRGVPAIFPEPMLADIVSLASDKGARSVLRAASACTEVAMPEAALDIDEPADLKNLYAKRNPNKIQNNDNH